MEFMHRTFHSSTLKAQLVAKLQLAEETRTSLRAQISLSKTEEDGLNSSCATIKAEEKKLRQRVSELNGLKEAVRTKKAQLVSQGKGSEKCYTHRWLDYEVTCLSR